jgi:uncharacterized membrane protein YdjX (TVP38/TMEM64 family)
MTPPESRSVLNRLLHLLRAPSIWIIAGLLITGLLLIRWIAGMGGPQAFSDRFGNVAPLVTVPVHIIVALTPFPSDAIAVANGSLYGLLTGVLLNWLGWWIAALLEFQLGRRTRKDFEWDHQRDRLPNWLTRLPVDHPLFLIGARQVPWLGGHVTTFLPGAAGVSWHRFWWCAAVGIVPSSILMASIGAGLVKLAT